MRPTQLSHHQNHSRNHLNIPVILSILYFPPVVSNILNSLPDGLDFADVQKAPFIVEKVELTFSRLILKVVVLFESSRLKRKNKSTTSE